MIAGAAVTISSQFVQLSALIGLLLPLLVSVVEQSHWPNWARSAVGVSSSMIAAVVAAIAEHKFNLHDWAASALTIFLMTKTTYLAVWKPSGLSGLIEKATSVGSDPLAEPPS
jgi:uncharacterized membrane protein